MFTERQANAILDMRLVKLIGLEIDALMKEHEETLKKIDLYRKLLDDHDEMAKLLIRELESMKKEYACPRKTALEDTGEIVIEEKQVEEEEVVFCLDRFGYAKVLDMSTYEKNREAAEEDNKYVFRIMNTDKVCLFTDIGKMHTIKVLDVPVKKLRDKGVPVDNLSNFETAREEILWVGPLRSVTVSEFVFVTAKGLVKRTKGAEFVSSVRTIQSTRLAAGDSLVLVAPDEQMDHVVLVSQSGSFLKFPVSEMPELKKTAQGVKGMALGENETLDKAYLLENSSDFTIEYGGREVHLNRLKAGKRGGKGVRSRK
jgi:DNA gyrase subunit A